MDNFTLSMGLLDSNTESRGYTLHLPWDCWVYTQSLVYTLYTYPGTAGYKHRVSWIHFTLTLGLLDIYAESCGYTLHLPWDCWIYTQSLMDALFKVRHLHHQVIVQFLLKKYEQGCKTNMHVGTLSQKNQHRCA